MPLFNQHFHTVHSDGKATMQQMLDRGRELGFSLLTFADHSPLPDGCLKGVTSINRFVPEDYKRAFAALQSDGVEIRLGVEVEFLEGTEDYMRGFVEDPAYDLLIGSVHFLPDYDQVVECLDRFAKSRSRYKTIRELYCEYFRALRVACDCGMFQVLGHLDNVSKQNAGMYFDDTAPEYRAEVRRVLQALKKSGMVYEVNTSGVVKGSRRTQPDRWICEEAFAMGIPVTLNTDAHRVEDLDLYLTEARAMLRQIGYTELATIKSRSLQMVSIE